MGKRLADRRRASTPEAIEAERIQRQADRQRREDERTDYPVWWGRLQAWEAIHDPELLADRLVTLGDWLRHAGWDRRLAEIPGPRHLWTFPETVPAAAELLQLACNPLKRDELRAEITECQSSPGLMAEILMTIREDVLDWLRGVAERNTDREVGFRELVQMSGVGNGTIRERMRKDKNSPEPVRNERGKAKLFSLNAMRAWWPSAKFQNSPTLDG